MESQEKGSIDKAPTAYRLITSQAVGRILSSLFPVGQRWHGLLMFITPHDGRSKSCKSRKTR